MTEGIEPHLEVSNHKDLKNDNLINAFINKNELIQQLFEYPLWSKLPAKWWDVSVNDLDVVICLNEA